MLHSARVTSLDVNDATILVCGDPITASDGDDCYRSAVMIEYRGKPAMLLPAMNFTLLHEALLVMGIADSYMIREHQYLLVDDIAKASELSIVAGLSIIGRKVLQEQELAVSGSRKAAYIKIESQGVTSSKLKAMGQNPLNCMSLRDHVGTGFYVYAANDCVYSALPARLAALEEYLTETEETWFLLDQTPLFSAVKLFVFLDGDELLSLQERVSRIRDLVRKKRADELIQVTRQPLIHCDKSATHYRICIYSPTDVTNESEIGSLIITRNGVVYICTPDAMCESLKKVMRSMGVVFITIGERLFVNVQLIAALSIESGIALGACAAAEELVRATEPTAIID